jgi:cation transport regulator
MPFGSNSDLPPAVKNNLPASAQSIWRSAFNAVYSKTGSDSRGARAGWAAVKRAGFHKKGNKWVHGFVPPKAGSLPAKGKAVLAAVYSDCRSKWVKAHPGDKENHDNKTSCAKQAWAAVHNAGFGKAGGSWARSTQGFIEGGVIKGEGKRWKVKMSGQQIVYPHPDYGTVRFCPLSYDSFLPSAVGRPVTLNHNTDKEVGTIAKAWVEGGDPWIEFEVTNDDTQKMMMTEGWKGGVSPRFYPYKLVDDPKGIAKYVATEWEFDSLGVGDGTMRPACDHGTCRPEQVEGMVKQADATANAGTQTTGQEAVDPAVAAEAIMDDLKAQASEDTLKIVDKIIEQRTAPLSKENEELKKKLEEITGSAEALKKFKEAKENEERETLVKELPVETGLDYTKKSLADLRELAALVKKVNETKPPAPKGAPQGIPEAERQGGTGPSDADIVAYNQARKAHYDKSKKGK